MQIKKLNELLRMRQLLQEISNNTFNFSIINKQHPMASVQTEEEAEEIIKSYESIIKNIVEVINDFYKVDP